MSSLKEFQCEICGIVSENPVRWFVIECGDQKLAVIKWDMSAALSPTARHFCGEAHAQVYISRWFESICAPRNPPSGPSNPRHENDGEKPLVARVRTARRKPHSKQGLRGGEVAAGGAGGARAASSIYSSRKLSGEGGGTRAGAPAPHGGRDRNGKPLRHPKSNASGSGWSANSGVARDGASPVSTEHFSAACGAALPPQISTKQSFRQVVKPHSKQGLRGGSCRA